jgi:hypothetical protein
MKSESPVKCFRDIREIPPSAYSLPNDGRQQKHLCEQRQRLAWLLASFANGDGTRIRPSVQTLATALGKSRRAVTYLLDDLEKLKLLENGKLAGFKGTRWRALNLNAFMASADAQSTAHAQSSGTADAQSSEDSCAIYAPPVAQSTRVEDCVAGEDCAQPSFSDRPKQQTDHLTASHKTQNGRQAGVGEHVSSLKERWQAFITKARESELCDEMFLATPKPEEIEAVLKQVEQLGGDIGTLVDEIDEWKDMQSPPLNTLQYGRWTRWLEQSPGLIASAIQSLQLLKQLDEKRKLRNQLTQKGIEHV